MKTSLKDLILSDETLVKWLRIGYSYLTGKVVNDVTSIIDSLKGVGFSDEDILSLVNKKYHKSDLTRPRPILSI